jgi:hypothetical protein
MKVAGRCYDRSPRNLRHEEADEAGGDDHRAGRDHRHRHGVDELSVGEPVVLLHHPAVEEGHDRQATAEDEAARVGEVGRRSGRACANRCASIAKKAAIGAAKLFIVPPFIHDFGGARTSQTSTPAPRKIQTISDLVITVTAALTRKIAHSSLSLPMFFDGELVGAHRDDADHRCADAVEHRLHPGDAAVGAVGGADGHDHQEGRQHEGHPDERGAQHAVVHVAKVDRELGRQGSGHQLGQCHAFLVFALGDPVPLLDQVTVHVADQRHRPAETPGAQRQHVAHELPQRVAGRRDGCSTGLSRSFIACLPCRGSARPRAGSARRASRAPCSSLPARRRRRSGARVHRQ